MVSNNETNCFTRDFYVAQQWLPNFTPDKSKVDWSRFCMHLKSLNLHHFKMVEAMGLKIMASRSPTMA
jgi:hypothetical protein